MILSRDADIQSTTTSTAVLNSREAGSKEETGTIVTESAESLRIRTELMLQLRQYINRQRWSLKEACQILRQPSPRIQNLMNGEIGRFSIEELIELLALLGLTVQCSVFATRQPNAQKLVSNGPDEASLYH
mgnify:CR=1 FL=1